MNSASVADNGIVCRFAWVPTRPVLVALLLTLGVLSVGPAFGMFSWHGPDAHSSLPHRGTDSPLSAIHDPSRSLQTASMTPPRFFVRSEPQQLSGLLTAFSTFHPPR